MARPDLLAGRLAARAGGGKVVICERRGEAGLQVRLGGATLGGLPGQLEGGARFRIWATRTLREHVVKGFALNERRLREKGLGEMAQAVSPLARPLDRHELVKDEGRAVLDVVERYTRAWRLPSTRACRLARRPPLLPHQGPSVLRREQENRRAVFLE